VVRGNPPQHKERWKGDGLKREQQESNNPDRTSGLRRPAVGEEAIREEEDQREEEEEQQQQIWE
jgi:hypothetical protein